MSVQLRPVGRHALLAEVAGPGEALALAAWARAGAVPAEDVVPAAASVLFDGLSDPTAAAHAIGAWAPSAEEAVGDLVVLDVVYDGPDLAFVAERWGTDPAGVVARHTATDFVAAFCGFAPGFAYLAGLPDELGVPRLDSPRSRVAPGSVGLAGAWCGVYPSASPGGWRLIGHTTATLWDARRPRPALLEPGTRVRFRVADR